MNKKKWIMMVLFCLLCLPLPAAYTGAAGAESGSGQSDGTDQVGKSVDVIPDAEEGESHTSAEYGSTKDGSADAEFTGHIKPSIMSVALPTDVKFAVDLGRELTAQNGYSQAINPPDSMLTVENLGVDLRLTAVGVSDATSHIKNKAGKWEAFKLVSSISNMPVPSALFSIRTTDDKPRSIADLESRSITKENTGNGKSILIGEIKGGESAVLNAYCVTASNWKTGAYSFYVTPTIKAEYIQDEKDTAN